MDKIKKFLKKIAKKDSDRIILTMDMLYEKDFVRLDIKRIVGTVTYRVRVGDYRIIFRYDTFGNVRVDEIVRRSDTTYDRF